MDISCQCGSVTLRTPYTEPLALYHCHCVECRRQSSSAYGTSAIVSAKGILPLAPEVREKVHVYRRPGSRSDSGCDMDCYFCKTCGSRLLHQRLSADGSPADTISIKGGSIVSPELDWSKAGHIYTDSAVVEIPRDAEQYARSPPPRGA